MPHRATPGKCQYTTSTQTLPSLGGADDECHLDNLPYDSMPGCYSPVFTCTTPADECTTPQDCGSPAEKSCGCDGKKRVCEAVQCVID